MSLGAIAPHLSREEIEQRFKHCRRGDEKLRWLALLKRVTGGGTQATAALVGHKPDWVRRLVRAYNAKGPGAMVDGRRASCGRKPLLDAAQFEELRR